MDLTLTFTSRADMLAQAKAVRLFLDRFRNGNAVELQSLSSELTRISALLKSRIEKDDLLLEEGLSAMSYLDQLGTVRFDGSDDELVFKEPSANGEDTNAGKQTVSEAVEIPTLEQVRASVASVLAQFDIDSPELSEAEYKRNHRTFANLFNGFRGSELDPLRKQLAEIVNYESAPSEPTSDERGVRELGKLLVDTNETRIQYALVSSAAASIAALISGDRAALAAAAASEYLTMQRLKGSWQYNLVLSSLTGLQKF